MPKPSAAARDTIIDAAEHLFADQGFARTSIKQIGAHANVNAALLYYYFQDKTALYHAVLQRLFSTISAELRARIDASASPAEALRALVGAQVRLMSAHPQWPRLLLRELLDHNAAHAMGELAHLGENVFERLCTLIRQGQRDGTFRTDVDARFAALSTAAQMLFLFGARSATGLFLGYGTDGPPPEIIVDFGEHAGQFAVNALSAPEPAGDGRAKRRPPRRRKTTSPQRKTSR
jgi:AcrR family transcriptional regulator